MILRAFIFPTYNEASTIGLLLNELVVDLKKNEMIVVVDDSAEEERRKLKEVLKHFKSVKLLEGDFKGGRGYAVWRGIKYILENYPHITHIIESDCDGSHRYKDIEKVSNTDKNHDFVIGSRYLPESKILGWSRSRRIMSRSLNYLIPRMLSLEICDVTNGLRRYSRKSAALLADQVPITKGFIYLSEQAKILGSCGISAKEIPIVFASRVAGQSSVGIKDLINSLRGLALILQMKHSG